MNYWLLIFILVVISIRAPAQDEQFSDYPDPLLVAGSLAGGVAYLDARVAYEQFRAPIFSNGNSMHYFGEKERLSYNAVAKIYNNIPGIQNKMPSKDPDPYFGAVLRRQFRKLAPNESIIARHNIQVPFTYNGVARAFTRDINLIAGQNPSIQRINLLACKISGSAPKILAGTDLPVGTELWFSNGVYGEDGNQYLNTRNALAKTDPIPEPDAYLRVVAGDDGYYDLSTGRRVANSKRSISVRGSQLIPRIPGAGFLGYAAKQQLERLEVEQQLRRQEWGINHQLALAGDLSAQGMEVMLHSAEYSPGRGPAYQGSTFGESVGNVASVVPRTLRSIGSYFGIWGSGEANFTLSDW